jgi:hypothetical protein
LLALYVIHNIITVVVNKNNLSRSAKKRIQATD